MLYVTTRNKHDAYTAARAWEQDHGPDGGLYVPFRLSELSQDEILGLGERSFGQTVANILNLFYSCRIRSWDVDFAIGRIPVKVETMSHRIVVAECWHNLDQDYDRMEQHLVNLVLGSQGNDKKVTDWARIAVRIAVLFGVFGELKRQGAVTLEDPVDIAAPTGDFAAPMAAWYARKMGLPIGNLICACNANGAAWDLLHHGDLHTDATTVTTNTPLCDYGMPTGLERLIFGTLGCEEANRFCRAAEKGRLYALSQEQLPLLRQGMYAAVISNSRVSANILSLYRTGGYIADPYTALAYSGLMDYRARTGESRTALILSEHSPAAEADTVSDALDLTKEALQDKLGRV